MKGGYHEQTHICQRTPMCEAVGLAFGLRYAGFVWVEVRKPGQRAECAFTDALPFGVRLVPRKADERDRPDERDLLAGGPRFTVIDGGLALARSGT